MALSRRSFLMFAANDAHVYEGPVKHDLAPSDFPADVTAEKRSAPVPVGAGSAAAFRAKCVGCMKCIPACPSGILRASVQMRSFGRPALDFRFGWCRPNCTACAEACPAGAIDRDIVGELKRGQHAGLAVWHRDRCVAASGKDTCTACSRHCPTKAITLVDGLPRVDPAKCSGCGKCEYYCPARPKVAMTVEGR